MATMRILSPSMFATMLLTSLALERPWEKFGGTTYFDTWWDGLTTLSMALLGATFAIAMVLCEFWLIMKSNAIVLMIGGVIKEMITIAMGVLVFGDVLNAINLTGFFIVFGGVILYKVSHFLAKMEEEAQGLVGDDVADVGQGKPVNYAHIGNREDQGETNGDAEHEANCVFTIGCDEEDEGDNDDFAVGGSSRYGNENGALESGENFADNVQSLDLDGAQTMATSNSTARIKSRIRGLIRPSHRGMEQCMGEESGEFRDPKERIV
mmetsp:Transcript_10212/g.20418  ORF Transcript_10212/g.20418 Transcript_10212/m.20418 type:complete len:266 (+) Transcript_10212:193-990(+)